MQLFIASMLIFISNETQAGRQCFFSHPDPDPVLVNGKQYLFFKPGAQGHQYLYENTFYTGSVIINGQIYYDLRINLDIYNQQLILQFITSQGVEQQLEMSDAWISSFSLNERNFEIIAGADGIKQIFQVIGSDSVRVLYSWKKTLKMNPHSGKYYFSAPAKISFLSMNGELKPYKNNRSFVSCFPDENIQHIKKYLKTNRIKVSKLNDFNMEGLIQYCKTIYQN